MRALPSGRSLLVAFGILLGGIGSYVIARQTSVFALRTIAVEGASPSVSLQVRRALQTEVGVSLMRVDLERARAAVAALPTVAAISFDRAFPHTLRVVVVPERGVAVLRQGAASWLVSARGRVMARLDHGARRDLPRIWIGRAEVLSPGGRVSAQLQPAVTAATPLQGKSFRARVTTVRTTSDELTLVLRSGLEIRLGDQGDLGLKLAVARLVLPKVGAGTRYVDVSVPEWPVAGSQFPGTASTPSAPRTAAPTPADSLKDGAAAGGKTLKSKPELDSATSSST
jgi:cell division protein FtsQ